jgi:hypothetical protein
MRRAAAISPDVADVVSDCLVWLHRQGLAASSLAPIDAGHGVGELVVQAFTFTFFVGVRARDAHPTRSHLNRQARWMSHGARSLSVHSVRELEVALRRYLKS